MTHLPLPDQVEVGRFCKVPTVEGILCGRMDIWPVIGPRHEDAGIIGFPHYHYHLDWRFFNRRQFAFVLKDVVLDDRARRLASLVLIDHGDPEPGWSWTPPGPVTYRRRKCCRPMPTHPESGVFPWLQNLTLYNAYKEHTLGDEMICPHKGASLKGLPIHNDCVVCPLHGLRWNLKTRRLELPESRLYQSAEDLRRIK